MQSINLNNYESFLIDYLDGNLDVQKSAELILFLEQHPEIDSCIDNLNDYKLGVEDLLFHDKLNLKKGKILADHYVDELLISDLHRESTPLQKKELNSIISHSPSIQKEKELYAKTILAADYTIVFKDKDKLKRGQLIRSINYNWAIAAIFILSLTIGGNWFFKLFKGENKFDQAALQSPIQKSNSNENKHVNNLEVQQKEILTKVAVLRTSSKKIKRKANQFDIPKKIKENENAIESNQNEVLANESTKSVLVTKDNCLLENTTLLEVAKRDSSLKDIILPIQEKSGAIEISDLAVNETPSPKESNKLYKISLFLAKAYHKITGKTTSVERTEKDCLTQYTLAFGGFEIELSEKCK